MRPQKQQHNPKRQKMELSKMRHTTSKRLQCINQYLKRRVKNTKKKYNLGDLGDILEYFSIQKNGLPKNLRPLQAGEVQIHSE